jgi:hypothetical protein
MKYAVEIESGAMIYIPNFIGTGSSIQKLIRGVGYSETQREHEGRISLFLDSKS